MTPSVEQVDPTKPTRVKGGRVLPPLATRMKNLRPRRKGEQHRTTRVLKDAILMAAELVGEDGKGKGELVGYLKRVAKEEPAAYCSLLGKVLPITIAGDKNNPLVHHVKISLVRSEGSKAPGPKIINAKALPSGSNP